MKTYILVVLELFCMALWFGICVPWLVSQPSDILSFGGILTGVLSLAWPFNFGQRACKRISSSAILGIAAISFLLSAGCQKVPAGNVGVKVYLLGTSKGVDHEVLGVGRYFIGWNEELYLFPTFQQNYVWTKTASEGSATDESIDFQTKEGMVVNADVGISYHLDPAKIANIFQKYRRGITEITDIYLRNHVRDALVSLSSNMSVEDIYGSGKQTLLANVIGEVSSKVGPEGIIIDNLYLIGAVRLPQNVVNALNAKIQATQEAQQRENEVQKARAEADIKIAQARGDAESALTRARAEAEANQLKQKTLTDELIRYEAIQKWDGKLPETMLPGASLPLVNLNK